VLGGDRHTADSVRVREVANADDGLRVPRDLAFNPEAPEQLWITNYGSNSVTIVRHAGTDQRDADTRTTRGADHFLVQPSALAFGQPGFMATAQEMDRVTQRTTPANFMGPTLWPSDYDTFDGGHPSHLDMLHNSPNGNGIAWETENVYWVVDGAHGSLTRYDFARPHEPGGEDHSDANVRRFANGMFMFMAGVSAHIEFDQMTRRLFLTEPARNRVLTFNPEGATMGARITPNYDGARQNMMTGGTLEVFIDGAMAGLERPSGLALVNNIFYITDNANSKIVAFNREGMRLDWVDLSSRIPPGSMQGIALDQRGFIYVADAMGNRIFEIAPLNAR
jgi:sugar lactone lactonase YvrE